MLVAKVISSLPRVRNPASALVLRPQSGGSACAPRVAQRSGPNPILSEVGIVVPFSVWFNSQDFGASRWRVAVERYNNFPRMRKRVVMAALGPPLPTRAVHKVVSYLRYRRRAGRATCTAVFDPNRTSKLYRAHLRRSQRRGARKPDKHSVDQTCRSVGEHGAAQRVGAAGLGISLHDVEGRGGGETRRGFGID